MSNTQVSTSRKLTVAQYLNNDSIKKYLEGVLHERAGQFITSLVSLSNITPGLEKCDPKSLLNCGLKATSLNLPLDNNLGFAYAIPYGNQAQFQMGYKGFIQLAQRTGQYKRINVIDVREGELKKWDEFAEDLKIEMLPEKERQKAKVIGYAGMFELANGFKKVKYWPAEKVETHGKRFSKTFKNGPWQTDFEAMAKKTVIKELLSKWGPLSTEISEAVKFDQSVIKKGEAGEEYPDYVDAEFEVEETQASPLDVNTAEKQGQDDKQKPGQQTVTETEVEVE